MINPEWAGVPAAVLVLISYLFSNQIKLRIINTAACVVFVVYGFLLAAGSGWQAGYSTIVLNILCVAVHIYYLIKFLKERKKSKNIQTQTAAEVGEEAEEAILKN